MVPLEDARAGGKQLVQLLAGAGLLTWLIPDAAVYIWAVVFVQLFAMFCHVRIKPLANIMVWLTLAGVLAYWLQPGEHARSGHSRTSQAGLINQIGESVFGGTR